MSTRTVNSQVPHQEALVAIARSGDSSLMAREWIVQKEPIATPKPVLVTPQIAAVWLAHNIPDRNRRVRKNLIRKYAKDMTATRWALTGDSIQFAASGRLLDGAHRLEAIINSGVSISLFVIRGLEDHAQQSMDIGARRTIGDQLEIAGHHNAPILGAAARIALAWTTNRLSGHLDFITDSEIRDFVDANPALGDAAEFTASVHHPIPTSVVCAATWRFIQAGHDEHKVHRFFQDIAEMRTQGAGDPKHALLNRVQIGRQRRERFSSGGLLSMVVRAWNADRAGEKIYKMPLVRSGSTIDIPPITPPR